MINRGMFTSLKDEWNTPKSLYDQLNKEFDFNYDPCPAGGYQDAQFGIWFQFGNDGWGVGDGLGVWSGEPSSGAKWTSEERINKIGEIAMKINGWLIEAKVDSVDKLKGIPVEITFDSPYGKMTGWRILTEVL